ncbi:urease accessory protein UreD [Actinomadura harenae]|uniref:Urease accessory protein UreD n=2 Tax=Actinomadura harenae TaxID=2483351 RepID=A0A3M2LLM5_9ACTN|nr:urease accessory protein UreD [Actinomadura harenae]
MTGAAGIRPLADRTAGGRTSVERCTPPWLPTAVSGLGAVPDTLPVGSPGKVGVLEMDFASVAGRTELTGHFQKAPLHTARPLYPDPARPDMPHVMFLSSGGGVLQGDRYRIAASCGPGTAVHFSTQTATRLYRMERDYATQLVDVTAAPGSYVEYLPQTTIPFGGSRYYQHMRVTASAESTIVLGDKLMAGRLARGERHAYTAYCADLDVHGQDGRLLFADPIRLVPAEDAVTAPTVMGGFGLMATLYVITRAAPAQELADTMHTTLAGTGLRGGASVLPGECGAWARVFGERSPEVEEAFFRTWDAVRRRLLGAAAPRPHGASWVEP